MAHETNRAWPAPAERVAEVDQGLRQHMLRVYNIMAGGTALTGLVAWLVVNTPLGELFYSHGPRGLEMGALGWVALFAPFLMIFGMQRAGARMTAGLYWGITALMGVSLAPVMLAYTGLSVARVFFITAAAFSGLSLWGYTTRRSLDAMGAFMVMGLWGLIIAMVVNWFLASPAMAFVISVVGVIVFSGLTAWDTQKIKEMYSAYDDADTATKKAVRGALELYLDFINLFIFLLRLMGDRR